MSGFFYFLHNNIYFITTQTLDKKPNFLFGQKNYLILIIFVVLEKTIYRTVADV